MHFLSFILYDENVWESKEAVGTRRGNFRPFFLKGLREAVREYHLSFTKRPVKYWGDKMPHIGRSNYFRAILELFAHARVINMYRDPRDVVASLMELGWSDLRSGTEVWCSLTKVALEYAKRMGPNFFSLFYEELCEDRVEITRRCLEFLGLEMEDDLANWLEMEASLPTMVSSPTAELGTPSTEKLYPVEMWYVLSQCRELMGALGYEIKG